MHYRELRELNRKLNQEVPLLSATSQLFQEPKGVDHWPFHLPIGRAHHHLPAVGRGV